MKFKSYSEKDTEKIGEMLARKIKRGEIIRMYGDLGAGKTAFTRGLVRGLGYNGRVTSPTFTVVNEYEASIPVFHFDAYRLSGEEELYDIGFEDYLNRNGVCVIEWSEIVDAILPSDSIKVTIKHGTDVNTRDIEILGVEEL